MLIFILVALSTSLAWHQRISRFCGVWAQIYSMAAIMRESPDIANGIAEHANGTRPSRRSRRAPPGIDGYDHSKTPHSPNGAHSPAGDQSFAARARDQPEGNLNYTTRKPVPEFASELSEESTTPRGLPPGARASNSNAPEIQVSSPPPGSTSSAGPARSNTMRSDAGEDSRRDWASDRSPLQKLEVTLTGISKEEKRLRVREAEAKARERMARKKAKEEKAALAAAARQASEQPVEDSQKPRSAGNKNERNDVAVHRDRRNGHENATQQQQPEKTTARHTRNGSANPQYPAVRRPENPQFAQAQVAIPASAKMGNVPKRSVTVRGPAKPGLSPSIGHSRSMSHAAPRPGQVPSALRAERSPNLSPAPLAPQDSAESQSKPKNVSFNVPPPTPPPVFEWRGAQPAQLRASDFDFQNLDINRSKAWWEGGDNKDRRKSRALPKNYKTPAQKLTGKSRLISLLSNLSIIFVAFSNINQE